MSCSNHLDRQEVIARLDGVWKRFRLQRDRAGTIRERFAGIFRHSARENDFWALRNVSFDVHAGETVGVIGANGSGKTTILKLLAGITASTTGSVLVGGKCSALIELGAGFHPELSGRDNIFVSGAILGLGRGEIRRRYRSIVDFAELQHFIDTPVKYYSSGMVVRLGFAIAISVDADLLLVDEALSVGDRSFQEKCLDKVAQMQQEGRSFVVVSHSLDMLACVCDRIVWMDAGTMRADGDPKSVILQYLSTTAHP